MSNPTALVQKIWNYCNILRDDGLSYGVAEVEWRLSVVEELESVVTANLQRAIRLRQAILQAAFQGNRMSDGLTTTRQARLCQSILLKAFIGEL